MLSNSKRLLNNIRYVSCEDCRDFPIILDESCCEEFRGVAFYFCFPIDDFSAYPLGNAFAAVAAALDVARFGKVHFCDLGGCGRSGMVYGMTVAYLASKMGWDEEKLCEYLEGKRISIRDRGLCPELPEQKAAIRLVYLTSEYAKSKGRDAFEYLPYITVTYVKGKPVIAVRVTECKNAKFLPIWGEAREGAYAATEMDVYELMEVGGENSERLLENFKECVGEVVLKKPDVVIEELYDLARYLAEAFGGLKWEE